MPSNKDRRGLQELHRELLGPSGWDKGEGLQDLEIPTGILEEKQTLNCSLSLAKEQQCEISKDLKPHFDVL